MDVVKKKQRIVVKARQGFLLLIVIGLLGSLAFLGISLISRNDQSKQLSDHWITRTQTYLMARSGIEYGIARGKEYADEGFVKPGVNQLRSVDGVESSWLLDTLLAQEKHQIEVKLKSSSGSLNLNDGVVAGQLELGHVYRANALDPWPDSLKIMGNSSEYDPLTGIITSSSNSFVKENEGETVHWPNGNSSQIIEWIDDSQVKVSPAFINVGVGNYIVAVTDTSALINLRLRRLLNAYGDVHRFRADIGSYPEWSGQATEDATFQIPVNFTSSATADRATPMPSGVGLGDVIINARPNSGFLNVLDIKEIVNQWGREQLTQVDIEFLKDRSFFDLISADLTVCSYLDNEFFRLKREFGVYQNHIKLNSVGEYQINRTVASNKLLYLEDEGLTFDDIWQKHPIALINLNAASFEVRAATFYAPVNASYLFKSGRIDEIKFIENIVGTGSPWHTKAVNMATGIVPSSPLFSITRLKENGLPFSPEAGGSSEQVVKGNHPIQVNRLMSLRDALVLSKGYEKYVEIKGLPDSFTAFADMLRALESEKINGSDYMQMYERALENRVSDNEFPHHSDSFDFYFRQTYVERSLPHLFSCVRRIPSWLGAPSALTSPYLIPTSRQAYNFGYRSVEDFVWRFHLPKVCFMPTGFFNIDSVALLDRGNSSFHKSIQACFKLFETKYFRTQHSFVSITDTATSSAEINIGPEPWSVDPSIYLGTAGLYDRRDNPSTSMGFNQYPYGARHFFDKNSPNVFSSDPIDESAGNTLFPPITSSSEKYFEDETFEIEERWPEGEPYTAQASMANVLPNNFSYSQSFINAIRSPSIYPGKTWLEPRSAPDLLSIITGKIISQFSSLWLLYATEVIVFNKPPAQFFFENWNTLVPNPPAGSVPPGPSASMYEIYWELIRQNSPLNLPWHSNESVAIKGFLTEKWTTGRPRLAFFNHSAMSSAFLEGEDKSYFANGSEASDLSPFNGVMFSSRGRGPRSNDKFEDSFFFRPYFLLDPEYRLNSEIEDSNPGNNGSPGQDMSKGMVSFWFRVPTSYGYGERMLFDLTLWEDAVLGQTSNHDPTMTSSSKRSTHIYAYVAMFPGAGANSKYPEVHVMHYDNSQHLNPNNASPKMIDILSTGYPPNPSNLAQDFKYMGAPFGVTNNIANPLLGNWFYDAYEDFSNRKNFQAYRSELLYPGTWHRLIIGWNYRNIDSNGRKRFWVIEGNRADNFMPMKHDTTLTVDPLPSQNTHMMMAFGELPFYYDTSTNVTFGSTASGFSSNSFHSLFRLDSTIDNIDMRFGDDGFDNSWFGFSGVLPVLDTQVKDEIESDDDFMTWRYNIRPGNEPRWVVDFSKLNNSQWSGNIQLISIGSRIFDVAYDEYRTDESGLPLNQYFKPAPKIDINMERLPGGVISETYASPENTKGVLFQKDRDVNTHSSKSIKTYAFNSFNPSGFFNPVSENVRMTLTYRSLSPNGISIDPGAKTLADIPWIQEISCRYIPKNGSSWPLILNWKEQKK